MKKKSKGSPQKSAKAFVTFRKGEIWVSELFSFIIASLIFICLLFLGSVIIRKEFVLRDLDTQIANHKKDTIHLRKDLLDLQERYHVSAVLKSTIRRNVQPNTIYRLTDIVLKNSRQFGYDPLLLLAVIEVESSFNPNALGRFRSGRLSGALGLMQIKYNTALEVADFLEIENLSPNDLFDPEINTVIGTAYLTRLISQFGSFKLGLLAYNQGPGTIRGYLIRKEPLSVGYYERVLASYYRMREQLNSYDSIPFFSEK
ncbi:lytic transglycosylase domain-containing protein [Chitinispirillales bacterium ANBcel5]|uniref:lytic transglycosylase domain-containing protein n=1 Tax=Cellulosispirillum alkaliphilum TaxID=3039283 RepID=UPI002A5180FF|nr:lytic transglycosylase domain-containing protein [Chitinispirillales bacterium ANBcel5]